MHDPMVVAFEIRRPWPKRVNWAERRWYWPSVITVWHVEPKGHDAGEICRHYDRQTRKVLNGWRWHVHHWRIQIGPLQELRRRLLTRCAWCGGLHSKLDPVNNSQQWDRPRGKWWRGEPGLYHRSCISFFTAHVACLCTAPLLDGGNYGHCAKCGKYRAFGRTETWLAAHRILAARPEGDRDAETYNRFLEAIKLAAVPAEGERP